MWNRYYKIDWPNLKWMSNKIKVIVQYMKISMREPLIPAQKKEPVS